MREEKKNRMQKEKERLEALQGTERRFLKGMYSDLFGKTGGTGEREERGTEAAPGLSEGTEKESFLSFGARAEEAGEGAGRIAEELSSRKDALQRANEALKEVQSLFEHPLYDGMPSLTGAGREGAGGKEVRNSSASGASMPGIGDAGLEPGSVKGRDLVSAGAESSRTFGGSGAGEFCAAEASAQPGPETVQEKPEKDPMEELEELIGLESIKHDVRELTDFVKIQKLRSEGGLKAVPVSLHLVFTGNPGTGKTTVARILARLYRQIGVLSKGQLVEVDRSGLVAGYVGQTALKTAKKIEEAKGGILFIDEAYSLARRDDAFGQEAIDTILKAMEDNRDDFVVIVAGYTGPMENFINSNPGLKSRFNKYIEFPDYSVDELMGIFDMNCRKYDYEAEEDVRAQVRAMIVQRKLASPENFANAREVRNLFEEIITNQARRVASMKDPSQEDMKKLLTEDLVETAQRDADRVQRDADRMQQEADRAHQEADQMQQEADKAHQEADQMQQEG